MKVLLVIAIITMAFFVIHFLFPLVQVCGDSMYPTYKDGEILIGYRTFLKSHLKIGDVIIFKCPTDGRTVVKRIADISTQVDGEDILFYCLGDNSEHSYDSRSYGYFSSRNLICRVFKQRRHI